MYDIQRLAPEFGLLINNHTEELTEEKYPGICLDTIFTSRVSVTPDGRLNYKLGDANISLEHLEAISDKSEGSEDSKIIAAIKAQFRLIIEHDSSESKRGERIDHRPRVVAQTLKSENKALKTKVKELITLVAASKLALLGFAMKVSKLKAENKALATASIYSKLPNFKTPILTKTYSLLSNISRLLSIS
ncbi:MAG: hypothetical protein P0S95_00375 [Rhabdochlamydiaceae bacterium]|nr:hypothetical protein [Candidatus Amphrikana amoebophyrae]